MNKPLLIVIGLVVAAFAALFLYVSSQSQHADSHWVPYVAQAAYDSSHPRVVVDQAHYNVHTARGKFRPFARLLRADGCTVRGGKDKFTASSLGGVDVLVIVNASGGRKPNIGGLNLPISTKKKREDPAFTPDEIAAVRAWVEEGGALLLVADHAPMGEASAAMAEAFGVHMNKGFVEIPNQPSDPMPFSRENGRLGEHSITAGNDSTTRIERVLTFTGQSLDGPPEAAVLLRLPDDAVEYVPHRDGDKTEMKEQPAGAAQGLALEYGKGRVVVMGEAAALTAQVYKDERFGMNSPDCDNRQFVLNVVHWLTRKL